MILGISFLMLVSLMVSAVLAAVTGYFEYLLPGARARVKPIPGVRAVTEEARERELRKVS